MVIFLTSIFYIGTYRRSQNIMRVSKTKKYAFSVFITLLISTMSLSILAFAADPRTLLPEVQEIIVKKTWHGEMVQNVEYTLLKWLAYVVDYISEAVDQVLNFNLYNVIKDVFNIVYYYIPIAWAWQEDSGAYRNTYHRQCR